MKKFIRLLHSAKKPLAIVLISAFLFMTLASCNWLDELRLRYGVINDEATVIRWNDTNYVYTGSHDDGTLNLITEDGVFTTSIETIEEDVPILVADMFSSYSASINITKTLLLCNGSFFVREDLADKFHDAVLYENCNGAFVLMEYYYDAYTVEAEEDNAFLAQLFENVWEKGSAGKWGDYKIKDYYTIGRNDENGFCFEQGRFCEMWDGEKQDNVWAIAIRTGNEVNPDKNYDDGTYYIFYMLDFDDVDKIYELLNNLDYGAPWQR